MNISDEKLHNILWRRGILDWKLKLHQRDLYDSFWNSDHRKFLFLCSRRIGKSFTLVVIALETALRKPGAQVRYAAPTQRNVKEIIQPLIKLILADCPKAIRPKWRAQDSKYVFPNGSEISIAGTDNGNADRLRGTACDLAILDEAAFMDDLNYVIKSILMPQFITTDGRLLMGTSPPKSPGHEITPYIGQAEMTGAIVKKTIYDDSRPEVLARIPEWMEESGGPDSTDWLREYMVQLITDKTLAVVPEFDNARADRLVREVERPQCFDAYVGMDVGIARDLTAVLFGYWDFLNAKLVIEDELEMNKMTTDVLAEEIKAKESRLWTPDRKPFLRVSDVEPLLINDLGRLHGLYFSQTKKDDKEAAVNLLRLLIRQDKLLINPRCKRLVAHLKYAVWKKNRAEYERMEGFGHFDFVDALVYLVRNIRRDKNPWPATHGMSNTTHYIPPEMTQQHKKESVLGAMVPFRRK